MNKAQLIKAVADKTEVSQKTTGLTLNAVLETIIEALASGDKVVLVGFGTFESRDRKAREGRNPKTGETIDIPATVVPAFSAGKQFKDAVETAARKETPE